MPLREAAKRLGPLGKATLHLPAQVHAAFCENGCSLDVPVTSQVYRETHAPSAVWRCDARCPNWRPRTRQSVAIPSQWRSGGRASLLQISPAAQYPTRLTRSTHTPPDTAGRPARIQSFAVLLGLGGVSGLCCASVCKKETQKRYCRVPMKLWWIVASCRTRRGVASR